MNKDEAVQALKDINRSDQESAHGDADGVLLRFLIDNGFNEIADEWDKVDSDCGGFWYT